MTLRGLVYLDVALLCKMDSIVCVVGPCDIIKQNLVSLRN